MQTLVSLQALGHSAYGMWERDVHNADKIERTWVGLKVMLAVFVRLALHLVHKDVGV